MHEETTLEADLRVASLPQAECSSCRRLVRRRKHRVYVRMTRWNQNEVLCEQCWLVVIEAAGMVMQVLLQPTLLDV